MAWSAARFNLTAGGESRFAEGLYVSGGFFRDLGVRALLGRTLTEEDDTATCNVGAVLSDAFWQREFGGDPDILSRQVSLDGYPVPVVGVTVPSFFGVEVGNRYDVAIPLCADRVLEKGRMGGPSNWWLSILGRLKPGWTAQSATAHLRAISPAIMQATLPPEYKPDFVKRYLANKLIATEAGTGVSSLRSDYARPLWLLMATTGLVLIIACANLVSILLRSFDPRARREQRSGVDTVSADKMLNCQCTVTGSLRVGVPFSFDNKVDNCDPLLGCQVETKNRSPYCKEPWT